MEFWRKLMATIFGHFVRLFFMFFVIWRINAPIVIYTRGSTFGNNNNIHKSPPHNIFLYMHWPKSNWKFSFSVILLSVLNTRRTPWKVTNLKMYIWIPYPSDFLHNKWWGLPTNLAEVNPRNRHVTLHSKRLYKWVNTESYLSFATIDHILKMTLHASILKNGTILFVRITIKSYNPTNHPAERCHTLTYPFYHFAIEYNPCFFTMT